MRRNFKPEEKRPPVQGDTGRTNKAGMQAETRGSCRLRKVFHLGGHKGKSGRGGLRMERKNLSGT